MTENEIQLYQKYLTKANRLFEFGSGGSTLLAKRYVSTIHTVDSSQEWLNKVSSYSQVGDGQVICHYVNIGPTKEWGHPIEKFHSGFVEYSKSIDSYTNMDLILVDGRFRVACILRSLLTNSCPIVVHDFWSRPHYHEVLKYTDVLDRIDDMVILKSNGSSRETLLEQWEKYSLIPA